jgi:hypothetical protein
VEEKSKFIIIVFLLQIFYWKIKENKGKTFSCMQSLQKESVEQITRFYLELTLKILFIKKSFSPRNEFFLFLLW